MGVPLPGLMEKALVPNHITAAKIKAAAPMTRASFKRSLRYRAYQVAAIAFGSCCALMPG